MTPLLEVADLRVRFRAKSSLTALLQRDKDPYIDAVAGVSFSIKEGETFGLVGESGSGKTTLARAITGLVQSQQGSIRYQGEELRGRSDSDMRKHRAEIAMMFQDPVGSLSPRMTIKSLLTEPFKIHNQRDRDLHIEAKRLLNMVGLPGDFMSRYPHQLSGGQARRVGVARALALSPKLIIADEPTAGLDVSVQGEVLNLLAKLQDKTGVSILVITHNLNVVRHITDRMAIMYLGRFVEQGFTEEIFDNARHPYTLALLSANPQPDPDAAINRIEIQGEVPSLMNRPAGCEFHTRCPWAQDTCQTVMPSEASAGDLHYYRCHYPLQQGSAP